MVQNSRRQVFTLHFAGGNCYSLNFVSQQLTKSADVHCLELPGRGKRIGEPCILEFQKAVDDYLKQIRAKRNGMPYVIYGHSMGATLGLYVCKQLEMLGDKPLGFIASGNAGPGAGKEDREMRYLMTSDEFKKELKSLGGIPQEVFDNEDLFNFFEPVMKADFEVIEKDSDNREDVKLSTPIIALMGDEEETVDEINNWRKHTSALFRKKIFKGNHFFINDFQKDVSRIVINTLSNVPF